MVNIKKRILFIILCGILLLGTTGCGNYIYSPNKLTNNNSNNNSNNNNTTQDRDIQVEEKKYTKESLENAISSQPVIVYSTEYLIQDEDYKCLYPDLLVANIKNNSGEDVKNVQVASVAWDSNGFPIKIDSKYGSDIYVPIVDFDDVNLTNGQTYDDTGLALGCTTESKIKTFKAIVVNYTDFDGNTWKNPLFNSWKDFYEDKKLNDNSKSISDTYNTNNNNELVKIYIFGSKESSECAACNYQIEELKKLDAYNKKFEIVYKELYVNQKDWVKGKDYQLGKNVVQAFQNAGFDNISLDGMPIVVISDVYAQLGANPNLENYIIEAYNNGSYDAVKCIENNKKNCIRN